RLPTASRPAAPCSTSPARADRPRPVRVPASTGPESRCDDWSPLRRMKAVNAVTTSWPGLRVDRPTFSPVAEAELDAVHRYLLFLTGNRIVAEVLTGETF